MRAPQQQASQRSDQLAGELSGEEVIRLKVEHETELERRIPASLALRRSQMQHEARLEQQRREMAQLREMGRQEQQQEQELEQQQQEELEQPVRGQRERPQRLMFAPQQLEQQPLLEQQQSVVQPLSMAQPSRPQWQSVEEPLQPVQESPAQQPIQRPVLRQQAILQQQPVIQQRQSIWAIERSRGPLRYTPAQMQQAARLRMLGVSPAQSVQRTQPFVLSPGQVRGERSLAQPPVALRLGLADQPQWQSGQIAEAQEQQRPAAMRWAPAQQQQRYAQRLSMPTSSWQQKQLAQPQLTLGAAPQQFQQRTEPQQYQPWSASQPHSWRLQLADQLQQPDRLEQIELSDSEMQLQQPVGWSQRAAVQRLQRSEAPIYVDQLAHF